jgi:hypothetical protein
LSAISTAFVWVEPTSTPAAILMLSSLPATSVAR